MTALYSILHMFVDGVCAYAMFGKFVLQENGYFYLLVYNFCAFALQMPLGLFLDAVMARKKEVGRDAGAFAMAAAGAGTHPCSLGWKPDAGPFAMAAAGVLITLIGAFSHPIVLGLGNALFHVGGGLGAIREDMDFGWRGRGLGVFVAPGAFGLYAGTWLAKRHAGNAAALAAGGLVFCLCAAFAYVWGRLFKRRSAAEGREIAGLCRYGRSAVGQKRICLAACCVIVVILRSYVGLAVTFSWKNTAIGGLFAVLAVVFGKVAGGFAAARFGSLKTAALSLALAAACYLYSESCPVGLAALFFFNMTMPVTLYLLVRVCLPLGGFAFGLLAFALFLGYLPVYFGWQLGVGGAASGCAGSILSLLFLLYGMLKGGKGRDGFSD